MKDNKDIRHGRHCVFNMHIHLVFVTKYRRDVFTKLILKDMQSIFSKTCLDLEAEYFSNKVAPPNAWLGVTVEEQSALARIEHLRNLSASVRFLSVEPLLEELGEIDLQNIDWVIVGGESGSNARAMQASWVESIQVQCEEQGAAFFFKQWGGWGSDGKRRAKKQNGRLLNGRIWDEMPRVELYR